MEYETKEKEQSRASFTFILVLRTIKKQNNNPTTTNTEKA